LAEGRIIVLENRGGNGNRALLDPEIQAGEHPQDRIPGGSICARLTRDAVKVRVDSRHPPPKEREEIRSSPRSEMAALLVGRVGPRRQADLPQVTEQIATRKPQQRPHDRPLHRSHSRKTGRTRALENPHQDSLDLIIGVMSGKDHLSTRSSPRVFQPSVAPRARERLGCTGPEMQLPRLVWQTECGRQPAHLFRKDVALRVDAVIDMPHDQLEPMRVAGPDQQVQKDSGIGSTRNGDQSAARLQPQLRQMLSELFSQ
jgi:hypothetical protein